VRDGDEYVINGQKIFTSLATDADYIWLAVRTDTNVKKHKGISIIIVPTDTPGFSVQPIDNFGSVNTNITTYEDVRVPVGNLVGEENQGWSLITNQLNHERVTLCSSGVIERQLHDVREWAQQTRLADGRRVIDQEWVQLNLARVHAKLEFLKLANWRVASNATSGAPLNPADASTIKVYGTEFYMEAARLLLEVMGSAATLRRGSPDAVLRGRLEALVRSMHILTFGGGTNEMQRDLIAIFGLNMPGSPR
jgi:alkylation response protein AidB-like acyl-CoA dehydrogenase